MRKFDMEGFWKAALKTSGPVAIVGLILWIVVTALFENKLLETFNTKQQFTIVLIVLCGLLICLLAALLAYRKKNASSGNQATFNRSTIKGDVVMGDKRGEHKEE